MPHKLLDLVDGVGKVDRVTATKEEGSSWPIKRL